MLQKAFLDFQSPEKFGRHKFDREIESYNSTIKTFDLLTNVVASSTIRKLKVENNDFETCDLLVALVANTFFRRLKV
jgi:hypothetical protein